MRHVTRIIEKLESRDGLGEGKKENGPRSKVTFPHGLSSENYHATN